MAQAYGEENKNNKSTTKTNTQRLMIGKEK